MLQRRTGKFLNRKQRSCDAVGIVVANRRYTTHHDCNFHLCWREGIEDPRLFIRQHRSLLMCLVQPDVYFRRLDMVHPCRATIENCLLHRGHPLHLL